VFLAPMRGDFESLRWNELIERTTTWIVPKHVLEHRDLVQFGS